ncbi:NPR-3 protein [Aphelenchoides avenae]|nr:NPR-3 protein [Aphelenchus avenae]
MHSPEKVDQSEYQVLFTVLYVSVWLSAILGNFFVIYVVTLKQVSLSSVRSVFIVSLAANDIVMSVTSLPITAVSIFTRDWVFPGLFCKLMGLFQGGSVFVSSFTLTAIAVDRYFLISHPASKKVNFRKAVGSVVAIWVAGYFFSLPVAMFSTTETYRPICGQFCEELWPDADENGVSQMRKVYGALVLTVQFGLPVAISSLCYWAIGQIIQRQVQKRKEQQILDRDIESRLETRKSRSNRMMISMVFFMVLAWLPMNLINLWRDFDASEGVSEWYSLIFAACHVVAMTSAVELRDLFLVQSLLQGYAQEGNHSTEAVHDTQVFIVVEAADFKGSTFNDFLKSS